jgi:glucose/arabinose dehydrogenase
VTRMRRTVLGVLVVVLAVVLPATAGSAVKKRLVASFNRPVQVAAPSWASGSTIYVVEQAGRIVRRQQGGHRNVVLNIQGRVDFDGGERGLLSVAFGPEHKMWVYFTNNDGNLRVVRYTLDGGGGHVKAGSGHTVFRAPHPGDANHNGGTLQFRAGHLYLSTGDGGGGCDFHHNAQKLSSKLGKLLRKDSNGWKIVGYGLRNPWRWSFDRKTGDLYIGDVGQDSREEVDVLDASKVGGVPENYGWNLHEGDLSGTCVGSAGGEDQLNSTGELIDPKFDYPHSAGRIVIGGYVFRGANMPSQRGRYFFADGSADWVKTADARTLGNRKTLGFEVPGIVSFGESSNGNLYAVALGGSVYKLVDN